MTHWCRICGGEVVDAEAWADLPNLGRFWLCPTHFPSASFSETAHVGYSYWSGHTHEFVILGPYPYEPQPQ